MLVAFWYFIKAANDFGIAITALATVFVAAFTGTLWWTSARLYAVAKESADAAKLSAEAAISVELPKLFVKKIDFASGHHHLETTHDSVEITITNYGRTPAFVFRESAEYRTEMVLQPIPDYSNGIDREPGTVILNGGEHKMTARGPDRMSVFLRAPFDKGQPLWVYGIIYYGDFLGRRKVFQFCARYSVRGKGESRILRFIQDGPDAYITNAEKK
jgi:hypothetical protein